MLYRDRSDAGRKLAGALSKYVGRNDVLVLGLPRGGVPVAYEVAQSLRAPLDVFIVRKLGVPSQPELAMGAVATGGVRVLNDEVVRQLKIPAPVIDRVAAAEQLEIERRERSYREGRPAPRLEGKIVILIDDGLATGSTMRAAARAVRTQRPARTIIAVPLSASVTVELLRGDADEMVCLTTPEPFFAVGQWYEDFDQTSDREVQDLLARAAKFASPKAS
jgi:putative phosphoribosyl transferase